jgi:PKD repeat protein
VDLNSINRFVALLLAIIVAPALLAGYPLPGSDKQATVICTGCLGRNFDSAPNAGKPTYPYSAPINKHVGRMVDSSSTKDIQSAAVCCGPSSGPTGTVRANKIRIGGGTNPTRIYAKMGRGLGAYTLSTFFSSKLPAGMKSIAEVANVGTSRTSASAPNEQLTVWDAYIYAENYVNSQWGSVYQHDAQDVLLDFDVDDRGYIYTAYSLWGWAIHQDSGETGGVLLPVLKYTVESAAVLTVFKSGSSYYVAVAEHDQNGTHKIWNVTNPSSPTLVRSVSHGLRFWAKSDAAGRIAIIDQANQIRIYDTATYATGGAPLVGPIAAGAGRSFADVAFDESGNLWAAESSSAFTAVLHRFTPNGAGTSYTRTEHSVGESFSAQPSPPNTQLISAGGGYVALAGMTPQGTDVMLFKVEGNSVRKLDLKNFFNKYYHHAPAGYANPPSDTSYVVSPYGLKLVKQANKLYLMYHAHGMGDVYEIEAGDSIGASMRTNNFGTTNAHSKATQTGPFLGDPVKFVANSSNPSVNYQVSWDFGNPESGANLAQTSTGTDVTHQFAGYTTTGNITSPKKVTATAVTDPTLTDSITVSLKVPTQRLGIAGTDTTLSAVGPAFTLLLGDSFSDASDGSVEGHYTSWSIDNAATVQRRPNETVPAGSVGAHTVTMVTHYGRYDASTFTPATSMYSPQIVNQPYVVRPFLATISAVKSGTNAVFSGNPRVTNNNAVLTALTWTYTWTLKSAANTVVQTQTGVSALNTIPSFSIPMETVPTGGTVTLDIDVPPANVVGAPAEYAKFSTSMTLEKPSPAIAKTGCANANAPCTLTASGSGVSGSTFSWTLTGPVTLTGTGNPYTPTLTQPGSYTVTVVALKGIFEGTAQTTLSVAGAVCGPPPTDEQMTMSSDCNGCDAGTTVTFRTYQIGYTRQDCDVYTWSWGDNTTGTTVTGANGSKPVTHKYTNAGTYTARVTISNASGTGSTLQLTTTVNVGGTTEPPPPTSCTKATNIIIEYAGPGGCGSNGTACKAGDRIAFAAYKNNGDQLTLSCDTAAWSWGDGGSGSGRNAFKTFQNAGTYPVTVTVTTQGASGSPATATLNVTVAPGTTTGTCSTAPTVDNLIFDYRGAACNNLNSALCQRGENIQFDVKTFGYTFASCDKFEWDFGDGSALATVKNPTHAFNGPAASYRVSVRVYNNANPTGITLSMDVPFDNAPAEPTPTIIVSGPTTVGKGVSVTFTATATLNATGWSWDFGDGSAKDNSQISRKDITSTVTHTFTKTGTFNISVKAKNANDSTERSTGTGLLTNVNVSETPVYKFLLPAVIHDNGQNGSLWRTDVQVYYPAPNPSSEPLRMSAEFNGGTDNLEINRSTHIYEDFVKNLITGNGSGSVILTTQTKYKPQIWTRTYNVDPSGKTFGQFIPAIELTGAAGSSVVGSADPVKYYLSGLRANSRFRTNVGFINTSGGDIIADVTAYDDLRNPLDRFAVTLPQYQLQQFSLAGKIANAPNRPISLEISIPAGKSLVGYASFIDGISNDPVYLSASSGNDLASADYSTSITPGVGHVGPWRSDVTIFNPDERNSVTFDLEYYDEKGLPRGSARNLTLGPLQSKNYEDLLRVTELFPNAPPDGVGMLKLKAIGQAARYPLTFSRTYNDQGAAGTFGQGIPGFAASRANVKPGKPGIIAGVRSNENYKTNIGLTNAAQTPVTVRVQLLDPNTGTVASEQSYTLVGDASVVGEYPFGTLSTGTLKVEIVSGDGAVWAFASSIDKKSQDPEYIPASPLQ